jgi:CRISPR-associated protein Cas1
MDLSLNTFGTVLAKENGQFVVIHKDGKQSINPADLKTISISKGAQITSDAAILAIENQVDVMFVDGKGTPLGRIWSVKYGSISTIRRKQLDFTFSSQAIGWINGIIAQKIENQIALLYSVCPDDWAGTTKMEMILSKLNDYKSKVLKLKGEIVNDIAPTLRGWEGAASKVYFETIASFVPDYYKFKQRSQHPATDVFNAMLNYGYGILYGKVEGALIKAGIDPYVGVLHRDDYNRPVLAFDIIELYRVWVDYVVINLSQQSAVNEDCISRREDGSIWLETLGRRIMIQSVADYLSEVINMKGLERSRQTHIELYSQNLAQMFLKLKTE